MAMKVIIPAAGIGIRLRPHTHTAPKGLLQVAGKPILGHILDSIKNLGVKDVTIIIGYLGEMIQDYVNKNYDFNVKYVQQKEFEGLGHAIYLTRQYHINDDAPVMIVLGDTIFKADFKDVLESPYTMIGVREVDNPKRFGIVETDAEGMITSMVEKPENPSSNLAIVGIYYIKNPRSLYEALDDIIKNDIRTRDEYQLTDALITLLKHGEKMKTFRVEGWYDCGKAETLLATNQQLLAMNNMDVSDIQNRFPDSIIHPPVYIGQNVKLEHSIIGPNVSLGKGSNISHAIIKNSIVSKYAKVTNIILEEAIIGNNAVVTGKSVRLNVGDSSEINIQ